VVHEVLIFISVCILVGKSDDILDALLLYLLASSMDSSLHLERSK